MIYEHLSYKSYFNELSSKRGRGTTTSLAEFLNCRPGYISQVLKGNETHFSLEHLLKACEFFGLTEDERKYALLLGQYQKAGSHDLEKFFLAQIRDIQETQKKINSKIAATGSKMTEADMGVYYSHWAYMAAHIMVSTEDNNTRAKLRHNLELPSETVDEIVHFLIEKGLIEEIDGKLSIGKTRLHLPATSPLVRCLHQNWRMKAIETLALKNPDNLHYSSVMTLSKTDAQKIRSMILEFVEGKETILKDSPDETAVVLNIDYFGLQYSD